MNGGRAAGAGELLAGGRPAERFTNAHTHLYSGLAPLGMPAPAHPPNNFVEILQRVWWRLDRALNEASLRASAELYVAQSLRHGTRVLIDHHESPNFIEGSLDVLGEVCESMGMHALLCYGVTERNGGAAEARRGLAENRRFLERCAKHPGSIVRAAIGVHASFTVSDQTLREASDLALESGARLHLHVAEDHADVKDARDRGYQGVIDRLDRLAILQPGTILAHGVHLTRDEVILASDRGCWFVQNPRSNRGNGVGYPRHLAAANNTALGTDGYPAAMREEEAALLVDAAEAEAGGAPHELRHAQGRLDGSQRLAEEIFGPAARWAPARFPSTEQLDEITARANVEAARLWTRMANL